MLSDDMLDIPCCCIFDKIDLNGFVANNLLLWIFSLDEEGIDDDDAVENADEQSGNRSSSTQ